MTTFDAFLGLESFQNTRGVGGALPDQSEAVSFHSGALSPHSDVLSPHSDAPSPRSDAIDQMVRSCWWERILKLGQSKAADCDNLVLSSLFSGDQSNQNRITSDKVPVLPLAQSDKGSASSSDKAKDKETKEVSVDCSRLKKDFLQSIKAELDKTKVNDMEKLWFNNFVKDLSKAEFDRLVKPLRDLGFEQDRITPQLIKAVCTIMAKAIAESDKHLVRADAAALLKALGKLAAPSLHEITASYSDHEGRYELKRQTKILLEQVVRDNGQEFLGMVADMNALIRDYQEDPIDLAKIHRREDTLAGISLSAHGRAEWENRLWVLHRFAEEKNIASLTAHVKEMRESLAKLDELRPWLLGNVAFGILLPFVDPFTDDHRLRKDKPERAAAYILEALMKHPEAHTNERVVECVRILTEKDSPLKDAATKKAVLDAFLARGGIKDWETS